MATCTTAQWSNSTTPQVKLTVTQKSETATTATLSWTLAYVTHGYAASTNGVGRAYSVTINGAKVKSGTYNINGLGGSNTRTIASGTTTINKGTAAKTVAFSCSFEFNLTWSGVYGGKKSASGSISVAKKTSYAVTYNANGGSGAPSAQTKWHGTTLKLSTTKPTRSGYTFQGWATSASGAVKYTPGGSYTANAAVTLYAVWKAAYWVPKITSLKALRCDANGVLDADGKYALVTFSWQVYSGFTANSATVTCNGATTNATLVKASDTKGAGSALVGAGALSVDGTYTASVKVTDTSSNSTNYASKAVTVSTAKFPLDLLAGGDGIAFGKAASLSGYAEFAFSILLEATKSIQGAYNGSKYNQFQPINANGNLTLGYGMWDAGMGSTNLYGNKFSITSKEAPLINGRAYGQNKVLWEAVSYLKADQTASLNEAISAQPHGVVLVFSSYDVSAGTANNYNWHQVFIPKYLASNDASGGYNVLLTRGGKIYHKFLYIHNTQIAGYSTNNSSSFSMMGQTVDNRNFVLRKVIGV